MMLANLFNKRKRIEQSAHDTGHIIPPSKLCSACSRFIQARLPDKQLELFQLHHGSKEDFMEAVQSDCGVCILIRHILGYHFKHGTTMKISPVDFQNAIYIRVTIRADYFLNNRKPLDVSDDDITFELEGSPIHILQPHITRTSLANYTGSERSLMLAREWLHKCQNTHRGCSIPPNATRWQPLRLIKLEMCKDKVFAKIHIRNTDQKSVHYLTLSHCWGRQEVFKLTASNYKELQTTIPINLLPAVFRHAMYVTLQLGYKYLWIDSLCICQDSREDWLKQSSAMGLVYRYADCNIAATGFNDGQHGLFVHRDPNAPMPRKVSRFAGITQSDPATNEKGEYYIIDATFWHNGVNKAPLNRRGWVVQERLLSSRTLHFGDQQLFWECLGMRCCEVFPEEIPDEGLVFQGENNKLPFASSEVLAGVYKGRKMLPRVAQDERQRRSTYALWQRIVQAYSRGNLTRAEDKLPAISGLAQHFRDLLGDEYLAGLWRANAVRDLLWSVTTISQVSLYGSWLAPTWSWASLNSEVHFISGFFSDHIPDKEHAHILDAQIDPLGDDDTGPLIEAILKIQGRVIPLKLSQKSHRRYNIGDDIEIDLSVNFDLPGDGIQDRASGSPLQLQDGGATRYYRTQEHTVDSQGMFALPLLTQYYSDDNQVTKGLVLTSSAGGYARFSRIGIFTTENEDSRRELFASNQTLPNGLFLECDSDLNYTVNIV